MKQTEDIFQTSTNFKNIFYNFIDYKRYFIFSVIIFLIVAFFYNKFSPNTYKNSTSVLINDNQENPLLSSDNILKGIGMIGGNKNIENEMGALRSFNLINKTLMDLGLEISYFSEENAFFDKTRPGSFLNTSKEYYKETPFYVLMDKSQVQPLYLNFYITVLPDNKFRLQADGEYLMLYNYVDNSNPGLAPRIKIDKIFQFGEAISDKFYNFKVLLKENADVDFSRDKCLYFVFNHPEYLTLEYLGKIGVEPSSPTSSVLNISVSGGHPEKVTDFLNSYTAAYLDQNLKKKNNYASSTVQFIDNQIADVADSLNVAQSSLQSFRTSNQVIDLSFQGQQIFSKLSQLETDKALLVSQMKYYEYLKSYFRDNKDITDLMAPSSMNVVDPLLTHLITQLVTIGAERSTIMSSDNFKNPRLPTLEVQIRNLKKTIEENVNNNLNTLSNSIKEIDYRTRKMTADISGMPKTQLQLLGIERKFKLNDAIFTFLLQKRSEAQIARAANTPDYEVLDTARKVSSRVVAPKKMFNYIIALFAGLLLPVAVILTRDFLNNRVVDKNDVEAITNKPIIGYIYHNYKKSNTVIADYPKSSISESFRSVRTNLQIMSRGISKQVILVTSSGSGEGKSFISTNLASVFALLGKRTIIVGFDLRKPAIYQDLGLNNLIGISSYLSNRAVLEDIIQPTRIENLDFIPAGPVPPNPIELIGSNVTKNLIFKLKEIYDYIIIDTAPIGVVTDAYFLMNYADLNIYVTRQNVTIKEMLGNTLKSLESNKISNIAILMNDVYLKSRAYVYGYDSKYYTESDETSVVKSLYTKTGNVFSKKTKVKAGSKV
jgi:capsular exopolysaccharide synthesis family protein